MKVTIDRTEEKGFFGKVKGYRIIYGAEFSEEEKAIIKLKGLKDTIFIEYETPIGNNPISIGRLMSGGIGHTLPNPVEAEAFAAQVKEAMKTLKSFIDGSGRTAENESFEL